MEGVSVIQKLPPSIGETDAAVAVTKIPGILDIPGDCDTSKEFRGDNY